jgi:hypothetical protein
MGTYVVVCGSQGLKAGLNLPIISFFFRKYITAICHVIYCYDIFVPGGWKYGHTQEDGCGCVILFHFIHKLDL